MMRTEIRNPKSEIRWVMLVAALVVSLSNLPYLIVYLATPHDLRFVGTLLNPLDGDTYLAKMQFGAQGDWLFHLPYTAQDHPGAFVLTHYLALGHLAAWTHLPVPLVYHLARVLAGFALLMTVYAFIARVTTDVTERRVAFLMVALSSGLGWAAVLFGHLGTSDLVIPESNTFYSLHINPHFPLAMALMVSMFALFVTDDRPHSPDREPSPADRRPPSVVSQTVLITLASLALAIVQPFAVAPTYGTLGVYLFLRWIRDKRIPWPLVGAAGIAGLATLPLSAYTFWVTQADPILRGWTAQNVTLSPPVWDYVLGYGMVLALAVPGAILAARRRGDADLLLLAWAGATLLLLYAPFALQRRFSLGLHIPLSLLAALGLCRLARRKSVLGLALAATLPTTLLVLALALGGGLGHDPRLFVTADEAQALDWLRDHSARDYLSRGDVALASPALGLFIPAWAGRRVVYGHPFETVNAAQTKLRVEAFFANGTSEAERAALLREWRVTFVFAGPRERVLGWDGPPPGREVFRNATVALYQVGP